MSQKWVPNPERQRYFAGYYLKKELGAQYCIVLTQGYKGIVRYNGVCIGDDCYNRVANLDYIYRDFIIPEFKKYVDWRKPVRMLEIGEYKEKDMPYFNATFHAGIKNIRQVGDSGGLYSKNTKKWDYILFFNEVSKLETL
jgi:hypothetical protein